MKEYLDLVEDVLENGRFKGDRTGVGTTSVFGRQIRFNLQYGFPIVTTKYVHLKSVIVELLWFLQGNTNTKFLTDNGCNIWNEWALTEQQANEYNAPFIEDFGSSYKLREAGDLGPVYGKQWRSWDCGFPNQTIDQIAEVIKLLKTKPDSRRIIVSAWNPADLPDENISPQENVLNGRMALATCHTLFQFYSRELDSREKLEWLYSHNLVAYEHIVSDQYDSYCEEDYKAVDKYFIENNLPQRELSCQLYQRSADLFLGVPFNIASYALLTHMIAQQTNMVVGEFVHTFGDAHIYTNHIELCNLQLSRKPFDLPLLKIREGVKDINSYTLEDFSLEYEGKPENAAPLHYQSHAAIKGKVAV